MKRNKITNITTTCAFGNIYQQHTHTHTHTHARTHARNSYSPVETRVALAHLDFHPDYRVSSADRCTCEWNVTKQFDKLFRNFLSHLCDELYVVEKSARLILSKFQFLWSKRNREREREREKFSEVQKAQERTDESKISTSLV